MVESVESWFKNVAMTIAPTNPGALHLDDLKGWENQEDVVDFAFTSFRRLWETVENAGLAHQCLLVWPLGYAEELVVDPPNKMLSSDEPPSVYVMHPQAANLPDVCEEYRKPIQPERLGLSFADGYAYYRCFRPPEGIENDWEYERCLYFVRQRSADT